MTELDRKLQEIALKDWEKFCSKVGEDAIISAKICLLVEEGKSQNQISIKLNITERKAQYHSEKCNCE